MKKLCGLIDLINIRISAVLLLVIATLIGQLKPILILFLIALIHEGFHLIMCILLKIKIKSLEILPFGVSLQIEDVDKISSIKQILIYIAGPISCFVNLPFLNLLYNYGYINQINFDFIIRINYTMCFVNLIPIFPLDGHMILKAIFQLFFPYKKTLKITMVISIVCFLLFLTYNFISFQPMISIFLLIEQIKHMINYKENYKKFLIGKTLFKKQKKYKIINDYQMYKDVNNYKFENKKMLNDVDIATIELKEYI